MQERESTLGTNQQWSISAGGGGYRFAPRSAYYQQYGLDRYYVCIGANETEDGTMVEMAQHVTQLTTERMWNLCGCNNVVNVNVYYDHAYVTRYGNTTDSTNATANNVVRSRIIGHMKALQFKYLTEFNILINFPTPQLISCYGCTLPNAVHTSPCVCNSLCRVGYTLNHHYNINYIGYELRLQYSLIKKANTSLSVCFIGHDYCYFDDRSKSHKTPFQEGSTDAYLNGVAYYVNM